MKNLYTLQKEMHKSKIFAPFSFLLTVTMMIGALIAFFTFIGSLYLIHGDGMSPTFRENSYIITNALAYHYRAPERGDIVIASGHVLRVIGLPNEEITLDGGQLYLDGILLVEPYLKEAIQTWPVQNISRFSLGDGDYFLLCDNRLCYDDSRMGRIYNKDEITEKVIFTY